MWLPDRRAVLSLGGAFALGACGFAPVYGPQGASRALLGAIALDAPVTRNDQLFQQRLEDRLGRGAGGAYHLATVIETDTDGLGTTSDGRTTRFRVLGRVQYTLTRADDDGVLTQGRTTAFTGYSATGSTVATLAAQRDADQRLMTMLADQVIDRLLIDAPKLV